MSASRTNLVRRLLRHRAGAASLALLLIVGGACFASLGWSRGAMREPRYDAVRQPPGAAARFGTDDLGRDLLARTLYGGAISLSLGVIAAAVAVVLGVAYGAVAGFVGGRVDGVMMRIVDVLYGLPYVLLVMLLTVSLGKWLEASQVVGGDWSRFIVLALAIGSVSWLTMARVIRGQVLSLRRQPFIEAAIVLGIPTRRILLRHILPNLVGPIVVFATLTVPQAILQESFLSFLGVGINPPQATWGSLAADGVRAINPVQFDWWLIVFPCAALSLTLLALNFVGDALRDALELRAAA